jgi:hypothetical protein
VLLKLERRKRKVNVIYERRIIIEVYSLNAKRAEFIIKQEEYDLELFVVYCRSNIIVF